MIAAHNGLHGKERQAGPVAFDVKAGHYIK